MNNHLWRVSILPEYGFQPNPKPLYVVMPTEKEAREYAEKYLKPTFKIGKISRLGEQLGGCMFRG